MDWFIKAFIRASLLWFAAGIFLGLAIAVHPQWIIYRPAHAHMTVVGFLTMLVFGVGYQLLPRLFGHPLYSPRLAVAHLFLANVGLIGLVLGFLVGPSSGSAGQWVSASGGSLYALGAMLWVYNLWRTFDAAEARQRARPPAEHRQLPTLDE
jgi:cbb3-type cytochrome oxidase subunit 1